MVLRQHVQVLLIMRITRHTASVVRVLRVISIP